MTGPPPWLPLELLAVGQSGGTQTATGTYLRWFVQPYLGVPGIAPLHDERAQGFRLFFTQRDDDDGLPSVVPIDLEPVVPDDQFAALLDVVDAPGWKALMPPGDGDVELDVRLEDRYKHDVAFVRLDYRVHAGQEILLSYVVHDASTGSDRERQVALHDPELDELLEGRERDGHEHLSYGIHVDELDESITRVRLRSNRPIAIHGIHAAFSAARPFYRWSAPGGDAVWTEIEPDLQLLHVFDDQLVMPGAPDRLVDAMAEFYERYHGIAPSSADGNRSIDFRYPEVTSVPLGESIGRHYDAGQYRDFVRGDVDAPPDAPSRFRIPPQHAAALASADPAIAYLLGLFRVLEGEPERFANCIFKVQGVWGDTRRFAAYRPFDPGRALRPPRMEPIVATSMGSTRTVRDEATWRTHTSIEVCDLAWTEPTAASSTTEISFGPVAYLLLRGDQTREGHRCRAAFYVPQEDEVDAAGAFHFTDWYDEYPGTDIPKVLDGDYEYAVAAFDVFGQLSEFETDSATAVPRPLEPGEIQHPKLSLSRLLDPAQSTLVAPDIPLELEEHRTGHRLRRFERDHIKLDYSFFWPLDARAVWDRSRATGAPSVDHFELFHLPGVPRHADVAVEIVSNDADGVVVELEGVASGRAANRALHDLLASLGAIDSTGAVLPAPTEAALVGGSVIFELDWEVVAATVDAPQKRITLRLLPTSDAVRARLVAGSGWTEGTTFRTSGIHHGELFWNSLATIGGVPLGWKRLGSSTLEVRPAPPIVHAGPLVVSLAMPQGAIGLPAELAGATGLTAIGLSPPSWLPAPEPDVPNHFEVRLAADAAAAKFDRLMIVPADTPSGLEPGEYAAPPLPNDAGVDHPADVTTLFSEARIMSFPVTRIGDDPNHPNMAVFRGDPLPFTSTDDASAGEFLVYPDPAHADWRIVTPTIVSDLEVPLSALLAGRSFGSDDYTSATVTVAATAVTSALDPEVTDTRQTPLASIKIGLARYRPPPAVAIPALSQPSFGIDAGRPDYEGVSMIRIDSIYADAALGAALPDACDYTLFRLPADRVVGADVPIVYDWNPKLGGYQRDLKAVSSALAAIDTKDPLSTETLQTMFDDFAQRVQATPLSKQRFLRSAVPLDGGSRTVFLYAIKPRDPVTGKESDNFVGLSPPVYVEDPVAPPITDVLSTSIEVVPAAAGASARLQFEFRVRRRLGESPRHGYAATSELTAALRGTDFVRIVGGYRLYLATVDLTDDDEVERLASPDTGDFARITQPSDRIDQQDPRALAVVVDPTLITCATSAATPNIVTVTGSVDIAASVDTSKLPSQAFVCLRSENYLATLSSLRLAPVPLREV